MFLRPIFKAETLKLNYYLKFFFRNIESTETGRSYKDKSVGKNKGSKNQNRFNETIPIKL